MKNINIIKIRKILKRYFKQLAVLSLASKVILLAGFFSVMPAEAGNFTISRNTDNFVTPEIKLDTTSPKPIQVIRKNPEIKHGLSKEQTEQLAKTKNIKGVAPVIGPVDFGDLAPLYLQAEKDYGVPALLIRAVASTESGEGHNMKTSSAGAMGFGQFLPSTWRHYAGNSNPYDPQEAIPAMARLLASNGAADGTKAGVRQGLLAYNHSNSYVNQVLNLAGQFGYEQPIQ